MFAIGSHYHEQLENYGRAIRVLHKALVTTPTPIGWWNWTAYLLWSNARCGPHHHTRRRFWCSRALLHEPQLLRFRSGCDSSIPETPPAFTVNAPASAKAGESVKLSASGGEESPVLQYRWAFGDGVSADGVKASHEYTLGGQYGDSHCNRSKWTHPAAHAAHLCHRLRVDDLRSFRKRALPRTQ